MLTEIDVQREMYEDRMKAVRDKAMWENMATRALERGRREGREEGREEGRREGEARGDRMGRISLAQKVLRRQVTPQDEMERMPLETLQELASQLEGDLLQ